jgi:hypothetical protein
VVAQSVVEILEVAPEKLVAALDSEIGWVEVD